MICGCVWCNYCGVCCGGFHEAFLVCSYWICKPADLRLIDPQCLHICACDGYGYNCLWEGCICCAPASVIEWSGLRAAGHTALDVNSGKTVIINNPAPQPVYMGGAGYQMTTQTTTMGGGANMQMGGPGMTVNANTGYYGGGMNANVNMGGPGYGNNMNMNVNMNGPSMNAKVDF